MSAKHFCFKIDTGDDPVTKVLLTRCGHHFALIDPEAAPLIEGRTWSLHSCGKGKLYARSDRLRGVSGKSRAYMHRLIASALIGPPPGEGYVVDHINGCGLDNRRANLRWMKAFQNRWGTARIGAARVSLELIAEEIPF